MEISTERDFEMSPTIGKITLALSKAQGTMPAPRKNKKNPHFNSWYADLPEIIETAKPHLSANELVLIQPASVSAGKVIITTLLSHSSGEFFKSRLTLTPDKPTVQGAGSAMTYGRRYEQCNILNMAPDDDDDGNNASPPPPDSKTKQAPPSMDIPPPPDQYGTSTKGSAPPTKSDAPAEKYDPKNEAHLERLSARLEELQVPLRHWDDIGDALRGKEMTSLTLDAAIKKAMK